MLSEDKGESKKLYLVLVVKKMSLFIGFVSNSIKRLNTLGS